MQKARFRKFLSKRKQWEKIFWEQATPSTKKILMRIAIVLGNGGGAFPPLKRLTMLGLGGKQGNGKQMISWIHEQDFVGVADWLLHNGKENGVYNVCSPVAVTNKAFMKSLRTSLHIPFGLPSPEWMLKIGATIIGTEPELILKSRFVEPRNLVQEGFTFEFERLDEAVNDLIR